MSKRIGFVILSHSQPQLLCRLVLCLQKIYDNPPIAIHHDFEQCPIRQDKFPSNVKFVSPHVKTRWAQFSLVVAAMRALDLLYQTSEPEWFFLLSGADYPVLSANIVNQELLSNKVDALLDYREVDQNGRDFICSAPQNPALKHYASPDNIGLAWRRYVGLNIWLPVIRKGPRIGRLTLYPPVRDWKSPFDRDFKCFYGDQWFAGNYKVAQILLSPTEKHLQLRSYLQMRTVADECYYHSVLGNSQGLKISTSTRRFSEWLTGDIIQKFLIWTIYRPSFGPGPISRESSLAIFHSWMRSTRYFSKPPI